MPSFPYDAYIVAFASSAMAAAALFSVVRRLCIRANLLDDPGQRKIHDRPVPLAGGITVFLGIALPLIVAWLWALTCPGTYSPNIAGDATVPNPLQYGFGRRTLQLAAILFGGFGMLGVGLLDDKYELNPLPKFLGQLLVATVVAASGVRITLFLPFPIVSYVITVLWFLTLINAFNFMDNMNGLCAGLGFISSMWFALIAAAQGHYLVALLGFLTAGALLGFLPFNYPRAQAFLGDGGSHLVGYLLAVMSILPHFHTPENPRPLAVLTPLMVLAVPLFDLAWVVILRWRAGKPFYVGDTNHLSHRLVRLGMSKPQAVAVIWAASLVLGGSVSVWLMINARSS